MACDKVFDIKLMFNKVQKLFNAKLINRLDSDVQYDTLFLLLDFISLMYLESCNDPTLQGSFFKINKSIFQYPAWTQSESSINDCIRNYITEEDYIIKSLNELRLLFGSNEHLDPLLNEVTRIGEERYNAQREFSAKYVTETEGAQS